MTQKHKIIIGIDTGTHTGFAVWSKSEKRFLEMHTLMIHKAMEKVLEYHKSHGRDLFVRFEDARQVKYKTSPEKAQGAGYVKAHAAIWEAYLSDLNIPFDMVRPNNKLTKMDELKFKMYTGWKERTSNHARDAAMLVYDY